MDKIEFKTYRRRLDKTQKQMASLLGVSVKTIHSYEQGWRSIPIHVERQTLLLISLINCNKFEQRPCWEIKNCSKSTLKNCPAWEFQDGKKCWLINGTTCHGKIQKDWKTKMDLCRTCDIFKTFIGENVSGNYTFA